MTLVAAMILPVLLANSANAPSDLSYRFDILPVQGAIYNPWTGADDSVELRSFVGSGAKPGDFVAPVIRVAPGRTLTIDLHNRLEPCTADEVAKHRCFNDTNLHTHGLWVSPSGNSDNVLISIPPGERFQYQYQISDDHPAGTFWYHPHRHGSGYVQVGSGMAGALIVTGERKPTPDSPGDIDILLKDEKGRPFSERVMVFQQIQYVCLDEDGKIEGRMEKDEYIRPWTCAPGRMGRVESDDNDWDWQWSGRFTGINGKVQPRLSKARAGRFERWRLIHAGTREPVRVQLRRLDDSAPDLHRVKGADQEQWIARYCTGAPLPMWQIALDGLTRSNVRKVDSAVLFAGDRLDVLARFPEAGRYCVVHDAKRLRDKPLPLRALAVIEATGSAPATDGEELLSASLISAAKKALSAPGEAAVRDKITADLLDGLKLSSFVWHKPIGDEEVSGYREVVLNILETPTAAFFHVNGRPYDHNRIDMVLPLGKAEEWRAVALLGHHPLHIHVNPFQVIKVTNSEGEDVTDRNSPAFDEDYAGLVGEWKDTVFLKQDLRVAFRTRYERFTGDFVTHCHIMFHGDHGMMLNLRIEDESGAGGATGSRHDH